MTRPSRAGGWRWTDRVALPKGQTPAPLWQRWLWFWGIWLASVGILLAVALLLRWFLRP